MSASSQPQSHGTPAPTDVTALLLAWGAGDRAALDALVPAVYAALHAQAARALRNEATGHTLSTTALVHEAYLRLVDQARVRVENRAHFYGIAARVMRQILVDHGRARGGSPRGARGARAARRARPRAGAARRAALLRRAHHPGDGRGARRLDR